MSRKIYGYTTNTPTPRADFNETDPKKASYILNKPERVKERLEFLEDRIEDADGLSAYEVAVENGFVGTEKEWLASLKGDRGLSGLERPQFEYDSETGILYVIADYDEAYVSLGDSIAAGHMIDSDWESNYGEGSQYGKNNNTETEIVANCYTDLIRTDLNNKYGDGRVWVKSFARSGDTTADLISKLDEYLVKNTISVASAVTVCIGANDILQPALNNIENYINYGSPALNEIATMVEQNMAILNDDTNANSYKALINKLKAINPTAKYVFTTIHNPYKYLHLDESTADGEYLDGFFGPLMWAMPNSWGSISTTVRASLYNTDIVEAVYDRINVLSGWVENYIIQLNDIIKTKVLSESSEYFLVADTKAVFDCIPDRSVSAPVHYNDLVNVELTRGYIVEDLDWGQFWDGISLSDITSGDLNGIMTNIVTRIVSEVILPDIDPHPETYGHFAMKRAFTDALGWESLNRYDLVYDSNGGSGSMSSRELVSIDSLPAYTTLQNNTFVAPERTAFANWNLLADGSGESYENNQVISVSADTVLYAQWSNMLKVVYRHSNDSDGHYTSSDTGHMEDYALSINGEVQDRLGAFSNDPVTYSLPYGTQIEVATTYCDDSILYASATCDIYWNGVSIADNESNRPSGDAGQFAYYKFNITKNLDIEFRAKYRLSGVQIKEFWDCYITEI